MSKEASSPSPISPSPTLREREETDGAPLAESSILLENGHARRAGDGNRTNDMRQAEVDAAVASAPGVTRRGPFYAMRFRNFRLFFYGQSISVAGTWMQTVAQQWLMWRLTHSAGWLGVMGGVQAIPSVLFTVWGGQIADRHSRRTILIWTQALAMVLAFVLAALASDRWIPVQAWHVAFLALLSGIVNAFNMPAQQAFVTDMVDDRSALSNAIALNSLRFNLARVLGPMLAGFVLVKVGEAMCFALNGVSFLAVILSLRMMRLPPAAPQDKSVSLWEGFHYIRDNLPVLRIVSMVGMGAIFAWSVSTLFPVFATQFQVGADGYSRMMSANGIGAMFGGLALAAFGDNFSRRNQIYGGALLFAGSLLLFSALPSYAMALACLVLNGFAMIVFGISCNTKVQEDVPDNLRGRVMAVYSLVFNSLMPVGGLEIGFLAQRLNATLALRANAIVFGVTTLAILAWSQIERRRQGVKSAVSSQ